METRNLNTPRGMRPEKLIQQPFFSGLPKPVILLNIAGFWDPLVGLLHHVVDHGFAGTDVLEYVTVADSVAKAEEALKAAL